MTPKGIISDAGVVSSDGVSQVMRDSALKAVRAFVFQPGFRNNDPIECKIEVVVNFDLK